MTLTEQIDFLRAEAAEAQETAAMAVGIPLIERQETERAARLLTCAHTIAAEQRRRDDVGEDWA